MRRLKKKRSDSQRGLTLRFQNTSHARHAPPEAIQSKLTPMMMMMNILRRITRLLASQNSNECTITLAKPGTKYQDYLTDPTSYGNGKEVSVKMQEYGPYNMTIADEVRPFAKVHLAFTLVSQ
ncbi:unnamed protein product [Aspergillus oryzae RIB40]|uniref:DNA, SC038 n=2 Tax=Aspergillus oryzae TaxID=5062 RepID=Q2U323_ASPOR|nr:unnamed protein product [Aspergillus oryzae RIB40]EIT76275.1 hypothetical protein Ao3042_07605 [Aspergillus oryzae 3.042]KDE82844.1 hypothetical protein AO1008_09408 [Aspergillus oryzae 100-8]BAE64042.1 unnamed protein product [Aspergillus oryzae RIB40]|eukprot:EIT76275.1 hypothetical protein Ao3042_07605 [Aspergillus oryzae 3.042]